MIRAYVGSGGKTTKLKEAAREFLAQGKSVLVTTTTHMFIEEDTLLTDDAGTILRALQERGFVMAGTPAGNGKFTALSEATYAQVCLRADVVLVEADGSKRLPLKFPNGTEPVIPDNVDEIVVVCGLNAIGQRAKDVCHRLELVKACLGIGDDTPITADHVRKLVTEGYLTPLREKYPGKTIRLEPRHDGSASQEALARHLRDITKMP